FKMTRPRLILLVALLAGLLIGGAELGNLRQNRFGLYEFKYSDFIKWKPQYVGPAEIFAVLYGYFPLSFENFDAFVRQFKGGHSYVLWSFDWFFTGFIKMNWIPGFAMAQADAFQFTPISSAANVPTALSPFYADAGAVGMAVPLAFYVCVWAYLYHRSRSSVAHLTLFALYAGAFALSSFQAVVAAAFIAHQMAEILLIMAITWRLHARQKRRESVRLTLQGAL
ncbi:MAG TPA: hypothetical protein H9903_02465, partial [Candidatus Aquabacterium excrementipullorum]|nr:hypothetical protein [Candidatus Aquabacterium excrementipullorum]